MMMFSIIFGMTFLIGSQVALAAPGDGAGKQEQVQNVTGNKAQQKVQAGERYTFQFREKTNVSINTDVAVDADVECDADNIGKKNFEVEVDGDEDLKMKMICTENQTELGLQKGNTYQARNRNRYRYQEGFCAQVEVEGEFTQAKLKMAYGSDNQNAQWAYYNETTKEWVTVPTQKQDGYLVAETTHFSTWTLLVPEQGSTIDGFPIISLGLASLAALGVIAIIIKKKKY